MYLLYAQISANNSTRLNAKMLNINNKVIKDYFGN